MRLIYDFYEDPRWTLVKQDFAEFPVGTSFSRATVVFYLFQDGRFLGELGEPFGNGDNDYIFDGKELAKLNNPKTKGLFSKTLPNCTLYTLAALSYGWGHTYVRGSIDTGNGVFHYHFAPCLCIRGVTEDFIKRVEGMATPSSFAPNGFPSFRMCHESFDGRVGLIKTDDYPDLVIRTLKYVFDKIKPYLASSVTKGSDFDFDLQKAVGPAPNAEVAPSLMFSKWKNVPGYPYDKDLFAKIGDKMRELGVEYLRSIGISDGWLDVGCYDPKTCTLLDLDDGPSLPSGSSSGGAASNSGSLGGVRFRKLNDGSVKK